FVRDPNGPQRLVPYEKLFRDGIMDLGGGRWSVSVTYDDTNYTLVRDETKAAINRSYRDWLDSFNESEPFQMTFRVGRVDKRTFERDFEHPIVPGDDAGNAYREELNRYVRDKLTSASASMRHQRVMTFTCRADTHEAAARHFASTIKTFDRFLRKYKCSHRRLSGQARMDLINSITKPDDEPGKYRFDDIAGDASITSRDLVCPWRVWRPDEGRDDSRLVVGGRWVRSYSVLPTDGGWGPNVRDTLLSDLSGLGHDLVITVHVAPWETHEAARIAKAKYLDIADENASYKVNRSRPQQGYFIDDTNMPRQMYEAERGADLTREQLEHNQQHMFATCLIVTAFGRTEEELEDACHDIEQTFQVHSKPGLESWVCLREQCYASMLPLGVNLVPYSRNVLTKPLSMLVPFMSAEFSDPRGSLLGVNADTNNLIMYDRTAREHTNAMILGQSKGGKSVFCKLMMLQTFLNDPQSDQIILDPEGEYVAGVECLGQQVIKISESSADHVNPLDISPYYASTEPTLETNPLPAKVAFVQSLVQKMSHEITDEERNAIDVACARIYEPWLVSRDDADIPTLSDLTDALRSDESERRRASLHAAELLYTFVDGTSNIFNNPTNVDLHARIVDFSLVDMSDKLKPIAMLVLLDQIWVRVTRNRNEGRRTYLWIDEMQILIDDPYALHTLDVFWSRGRKWDLYNGAITQSAERVENISETSYMMANSPFVVLMKQHPDYATALAETYGLSEDQRDILESTSPGEGIAVIDNQPVHFDFSIDREAYPTLYRYVTTTPDDLRAERTRRFGERLAAARAETEEDEAARVA
ncbi:MAG: DUF87 domain-containing protein, partial [Olsenella sp.]|nr:DUF87 domain-containing protein [Olsenella sp.]